jgi:hypothetical protein
MQQQTERKIARNDVGGVAKGHADDSPHLSTPNGQNAFSIKDLKGCLAGRMPAPTAAEIAAAVASAEARAHACQSGGNGRNGPDGGDGSASKPRLLPKLAPGQACSIKDLKGCLAGRGRHSATSIEEMNEVIAQAVLERYLRSFA